MSGKRDFVAVLRHLHTPRRGGTFIQVAASEGCSDLNERKTRFELATLSLGS